MLVALTWSSAASCGDLVSSSERVDVILPPADELVGLIRGVGDASSRVAVTLGSGVNATRLREAIGAIERAFTAADAQAADRALGDAKAALAVFTGSSEMRAELGPDASVLEVCLLAIEASLQRPCAAAPVGTPSSFASCK